MAKRKKQDAVVERVEVDSTPVVAFDLNSTGADWLRVEGAIVRARIRVPPGEVAPPPGEVKKSLLDAGAIAAHVSVELEPVPREERVEGIASLPNPRQRLARYLEARYPSEWDDGMGKLHPVAVEALRVYEQEEA